MFIFKNTRKQCTLSNHRNIPAIFVKQRIRCLWPWRDISRWNMDFTTRTKNSIVVNIVAGDMLTALCWGNTCCLMVLMETNLKIKTKLRLLWNKSYLKHSSTFTQKDELKLLGFWGLEGSKIWYFQTGPILTMKCNFLTKIAFNTRNLKILVYGAKICPKWPKLAYLHRCIIPNLVSSNLVHIALNERSRTILQYYRLITLALGLKSALRPFLQILAIAAIVV